MLVGPVIVQSVSSCGGEGNALCRRDLSLFARRSSALGL
jgi:hypothetical protein